MNTTDFPDPDAILAELAVLGLRTARVVARMMEIEGAAAEAVACWLPAPGEPASLGEAQMAGLGIDAVTEAMAGRVPRAEILARAFDRVSRSVRRSVALRQRMAAGWPRAVPSDDRAAMVRRQVARGVADAISRGADGERAERLFDELAERLDDPGLADEILALPVAEIVRRICRDLGLAAAVIDGVAPGPGGVVDSC